MNQTQMPERRPRYEEDEEPEEDYPFEGLIAGITAIPYVLCAATIGRVVKAIRGKPSKLDIEAEGWASLEGQGHFVGEKD